MVFWTRCVIAIRRLGAIWCAIGVAVGVLRAAPTDTAVLRVRIFPAEAISLGAAWSVDGEHWQASDSQLDVPCGPHSIRFRTIPGCLAPPDWPITLDYPGRSTTLTAVYSVREANSFPFYLPLTVSPSTAAPYTLHAIADQGALDAYDPAEDRIAADLGTGASPPAMLVAPGWASSEPLGLLWDCRHFASVMAWQLLVSIPDAKSSVAMAWPETDHIGDFDVRLIDLADPLWSLSLREERSLTITQPGRHHYLLVAHGPPLEQSAISLRPGWNLIAMPGRPTGPWQALLQRLTPMHLSDAGGAWIRSTSIQGGQPLWLFASSPGVLPLFRERDESLSVAALGRPWVLTTLDQAKDWRGEVRSLWRWQHGAYHQVHQQREAGTPYWVHFHLD